MTNSVDNHPSIALSANELALLDAGENMDQMILEAQEALEAWGPNDEDYLKLAELERAARAAFAYYHRVVVRERRARGEMI